LTYTTIACKLAISYTQEKYSSVITAHESAKPLTLSLGIFKLRRITWPFLWKVLEYKIIMCYLPPCRREQIRPIVCSSLTHFGSSIHYISMITLLTWTIDLSNLRCCVYCQNYVFQPKFASLTCLRLKYYIAVQQIMNIKFLQLILYQYIF
jgi:hypothetical protein